MGTRLAETLAAMGFLCMIAVCRSDAGVVPTALGALGFDIVVNAAPEAGMGDSLSAGVRRTLTPAPRAILVCLADMPFVTRSHLESLLSQLDESPSGVAASRADRAIGPPSLFDHRHFAALAAMHGDRGARDLLDHATVVPAPGDVLRDIDRPGDLPGP